MSATASPATAPSASRGDRASGGGRATRAVIDLDAYEHNVRALKRTLTPGCELLAVVKANAYGHGASMVARAALVGGATRLGVATVEEGAALRRQGIRAPILLLGPIDRDEARQALTLGLEPTVATEALLDAVVDAAQSLPLQRAAGVHVKVDTGMRRYGAAPERAIALARRVATDPSLRLVGVSTHFATADEQDQRFTVEQATLLDACLAELTDLGIRPELVHAANSAAALRSRRYDYDLVRAGIALYGLRPGPEIALPAGFRPVLSLRSRVARVIDLEPGATVGYGRTYRVERSGRAALIPIGYGDGYRRSLSGRAWMGVGGRRAPVLGRVSMDQTVVGLPDGVPVQVGDDVVVVGATDEGAPSVDELAQVLETIAYEVVTGLATRVERHFLRDDHVVAIDRGGGVEGFAPER